jgi:hypothetical protein
VYGILQELYIMSIVAFLFAGVYILIENNASPISTVYIDDKKIQINNTIYNFDSIDRFTLLMSSGEHVMLRIFMKKWIAAMIDVPLTGEVDSVELKDHLAQYLTYDADADWTRSDKIIHTMGL